MKRYARNLADEGYPYKLIREYKALLLIFSYAGGGWMQESGGEWGCRWQDGENRAKSSTTFYLIVSNTILSSSS